MDSGEDEAILSVVQTGKDLRQAEDSPFWDDFINLCADAGGLAELLDVSRETVLKWPGAIRDALSKLEKHHAENPPEKEPSEMIPTADTGAVAPNTDPAL